MIRLTRQIVILMLAWSPLAFAAQGVFNSVDSGRRSRTYDVLHYRIAVRLDETRREVAGTTTIRFRPLADGIDSVVFDAADMTIAGVRGNGGTTLRYLNRSPELAVYLGTTATPRDTLEVSIDYACTPKKGLYFVQPDSCHPYRHWQVWSQGEDMDNHYWFPCYDFPNSKATSEVIATVREEYTVLSNGRLVGETHDVKAKTRTFHWSETKPHASYLILLAAGTYSIVNDRYGKLPVSYYMYPEDSARGMMVFGRTPDMLRFFETQIGYPFPWEKFSQILIDDFMWGGMENTTAVTMNTSLLVDERARWEFSPDPTVAHELAHQWWGDVVTCRDWSHLWLNEGFATYFEELYEEHAHGVDESERALYESARWVRGVDRAQGRKPIVSRESYTTNVYTRGAWVLRMLRDVLGERPFWNALRTYLRRHEFRSVETRELELAIQDATGADLDWFFRQWVYGTGYPQVEAERTWDRETGKVELRIRQTQETDTLTGLFRFPLELEMKGDGWSEQKRVWVSAADSTYSITLPGEPRMVSIDPAWHVLKDLSYERSREECLYVLSHSTHVAEREEAVASLKKWKDDTAVVAAVQGAFCNDPFWGVRRAAADAMGQLTGDSIKATLIDRALHDKDGRVRSSAVYALRHFPGSDVGEVLKGIIETDSSYSAASSALYSIGAVDPVLAKSVAVQSLKTDSYRDIIRHAALWAIRTLKDTAATRVLFPYTAPPYQTDIRERAVSAIGDLGGEDSAAVAWVRVSLNDGDAAVRGAAVKALINWGGEENRMALEKRYAVEKEAELREMIGNGIKGLGGELPESTN